MLNRGVYCGQIIWPVCCFLLGIAVLQRLPTHLPAYYYFLLPFVVVLWLRWPRFAALAAFMLGLLWAALHAQFKLQHSLPAEWVGQDRVVSGHVQGIPHTESDRVRFEFVITEVHEAYSPAINLPLKVRLSWYRHSGDELLPELHAGQRWRLKLRLKPPTGFMNPGGFDYEAWLFSWNIRATGYVRSWSGNRLSTPAAPYSLAQLRVGLVGQMAFLTEKLEYAGVLLALGVGDRSSISQQDWDLLLGTGTNHLVAISGLHVGLVAGLFYFLAMRVAAALNMVGVGFKWPRQIPAALIGWCAALVYAWLAGFALPTQRALIMLSVAVMALLCYRLIRPWQALLLALWLVLTLDPFAVSQVSFWLSFGAVAILVYSFAGRLKLDRESWRLLAHWCRLQLVLLIGLLPLTLSFFGATAATAAVANLVAIPLIGFIVVPLVLLSLLMCSFWPDGASGLLVLADYALSVLWPVLQFCSEWPLARWVQAVPSTQVIFWALPGILLLLAPAGLPGRWLGFFCLLPMLTYQPPAPAEGEFAVTVLDVGQGTAVVLRTANHTLLYDAGPSFGQRFDAGRLVVLPFLRQQNTQLIDTLVVSHGDNDHIGGALAILDSLPVTRVISSVPHELAPYSAEQCVSGQQWRWDGVNFEILHPQRIGQQKGNNASCVLLVSNSRSSILLTGDIEWAAERKLLAHTSLPKVSVLLAPHHGSRTSSTEAFIRATQPKHVVFTAGLFNRYGFPKPDIVQRYRRLGTKAWVSGEQGALTFQSAAQGMQLTQAYRKYARRYWHYRGDKSTNQSASNSQ